MARNRNRRRNKGTGQGTFPGPSAFVEPSEGKDGKSFWVRVSKPGGCPTHLTPTHFSVTLKGAPGQMLLHGSRCAGTWTTGKVPVDDWKDVQIQASSDDKLAQTTTFWFKSS